MIVQLLTGYHCRSYLYRCRKKRKSAIQRIANGVVGKHRGVLGSLVFHLVERASMDFGETQSIGCNVVPSVRSFAVYSGRGLIPTWWNCRERFAPYFANQYHGSGKTPKAANAILFSHDKQENQIAIFIHKIEDLLRFSLSEDGENSVGMDAFPPTRFSKTNKPFALYIEPSPFWLANEMRRQLFTILIRCGTHYNIEKNNIDDALWKEEHALQTKVPIMRFLFGFTDFVDDAKMFNQPVRTGWVNSWYSKIPNHVILQLTKSKITPTEMFLKANVPDCLFA